MAKTTYHGEDVFIYLWYVVAVMWKYSNALFLLGILLYWSLAAIPFYLYIKIPYRVDANTFGVNRDVLLNKGVKTANIVLILLLLVIYAEKDRVLPFTHKSSISGADLSLLCLGILSFALIVPIFEELLFRGLLYPVTVRKIKKWKAIFILSLLWGLLHFDHNLFESISTVFLGVFLHYIYERSGTLAVPIVIHIGRYGDINKLNHYDMTQIYLRQDEISNRNDKARKT